MLMVLLPSLFAGVYPSSDPSQPQPVLTLNYYGGDDWRSTTITITQDINATETTVKFISEHPYLQYNIHVTAKDIGFKMNC